MSGANGRETKNEQAKHLLMKLLHHISFFLRRRKALTSYGIHSPDEFRRIIERERDRADRNAHIFSIIAFDTAYASEEENTARHLVKVLNKRIRSTDETGWLITKQIGVLLPDTTAIAAGKLAHDICSEVADRTGDVPFEIYAYPSDGLPGVDKTPPKSFPKDNEQNGNGEFKGDPEDPNTVLCGKAKGGIEPLLAQRIPLWKRGLDFFGSGLGLILLSPLLLLIAILIKVASPGPVFFKQTRIGYLGRPFALWKFRTMHVDANPHEHQNLLHDLIHSEKPMTKLDENGDSRIIPFGNFLRQTGLDELPQLLNVLRGEMSLIGPRPCIPYEFYEYLHWHRKRSITLPGLTGLWQVSGKNHTTHSEMMRLDIKYAEKRSFWLDVKIALQTGPAIVNQALESLFMNKGGRYAKRH